jgi:hypothetical protein
LAQVYSDIYQMLEGKDRDSQPEHSIPEKKSKKESRPTIITWRLKNVRQNSQPMDQEYYRYRNFVPPNTLH